MAERVSQDTLRDGRSRLANVSYLQELCKDRSETLQNDLGLETIRGPAVHAVLGELHAAIVPASTSDSRQSDEFAGLSWESAIISQVEQHLQPRERRDRDAAANAAARAEMHRIDGARSLGENLEQADALIKAAYELADGFAATQR